MRPVMQLLSALLLLTQFGPVVGAAVCAPDSGGGHQHCTVATAPAAGSTYTGARTAPLFCMDTPACEPGASALPTFSSGFDIVPVMEAAPLSTPGTLTPRESPAPLPPPPNA